MKVLHILLIFALIFLVFSVYDTYDAYAQYSTKNYSEPGGERWVVGGSCDIVSGGDLDVESGASIKIAGAAVTASAAEINKLAGVTAGTATASKAAVLSADRGLDYLLISSFSKWTPTDSVPGSAAEGMWYFDDSENNPKYYNGSSWIAVTAGTGNNTLDEAYDQGGGGAGRTITADTGPVVITNTDPEAAFLLSLTPTPSGAAALGGMQVTVGSDSTQDAIQVVNSGSGDDIQAGAGAFKVSKTGAVNTDTITAAGNVTLENGLILDQSADNTWKWTENSEDIVWTFSGDTITSSSTTGVVSWDFGSLAPTFGSQITATSGMAANDDITLANGKSLKSSTTSGQTGKIQVYDNDTGPGYKDAATWTNGNTPSLSFGANAMTVAVDSSDWDISTSGAMTGIGAITADGLFTGSLGATVTGATVNLNASSNFAVNIGTGSSTGAVTVGGGSGTFAVASTGLDVSAAGALSNVTDITMTGDVTMANGKVIKGSTTSAQTIALQVYDNDTGPGYKNAILLTNGNTPAVAIGDGNPTVAVDSSSWGVSTTGAFTGVTTIAMSSDITMANGKGIKGSTTDAETVSLFVYDNDTGPAYVAAVTATNGNTPGVAIGDGTNTTITMNPATTTTFSDKNITNVGEISVDDIMSDASSDVMWTMKTVVKTIDVDDDASTDDFQFDDDASDQAEQSVDLGAILPAYAEIVSAQIRCFETVTGSAVMAIDLGTASGGAEILASANTDTANDISGTGAGDGPEIAAANAAKNVWINATPGVDWDTLDAGRWAVMVTYIDYGAVYTEKTD